MSCRHALLPAALLTLALALPAGAAAAPGEELVFNPGLELAGAGGAAPLGWSPSSWGDGARTLSWSTDAHSGNRSVRAHVAGRTTGDSKWQSELIAVTGNAYYTFSDWYKADVNTAVSVYYETADDEPDEGRWANLFAGIGPAAEWTRYTTGFTMPADAVRARFVHFIASDGELLTDDYSVVERAAPPGFDTPMVSLTFDDGSAAFYARALPLLDARGLPTTQYIPTYGLTTLPIDPFMMTRGQIRDLYDDGHEIGSHSVTHPDLTTLTNPALRDELEDSRTLLQAITGSSSVVGLAYPFGAYDARVIAAAGASGYTAGRSVEAGYNSRLDLERFDIRVQNVKRTTTPAEFRGWIEYAAAHRYWLVIVYHEVVPDDAPVCTEPATVDPCLGPYATTLTRFADQLDAIVAAGLGPNVLTVADALVRAGGQAHAPVAGTVQLVPQAPTTHSVLTAIASGFADPDDGDALTLRYAWTVDGTPVAGAPGPTLDLAPPGVADRGDVVRVQVTAVDGAGNESPAAAASATVVNTPPAAGTAHIGPAGAVAGAALTATPSGFGDADGDPLSYRYSWFRNGQPIAGQTAATLPGAGAAGDALRVDVRASDGEALSAAASASVMLAAATGDAPRPDRAGPVIRIGSPRARTYRRGQKVRISVTVTDRSGVAKRSLTLRRRGGKLRHVRNGARVRLAHAGRYVLRVTAKDRAGNVSVKTVRFRVARP